MLNFDAPRIRFSLGQAALREPYPSWLLDPYGVVRAANLMALWLWDGLKHAEEIRPERLVASSIFDIQSANFARISLHRNIEFYVKQSALVKRAIASQPSTHYSSFIARMKSDPQRARIYEDAVANPERIWEYPLVITAPETNEPLELRANTYRLEGEAGFLVLTTPTATSLPTIEQQYSQIMTTYGEEAYVISDGQDGSSQNMSFLSHLPDFYRMYYPTLVQDPLWYLIEENKAMQAMFGGSVVGMHFFELFFAPQLRPWLGPLQETSAPRAMRYFETFTAPLRQETHELHAAYTQVLQRLWQLPEYRRLIELSWKSNIHLNLPENKDIPFYTCRVFLPWAIAPQITLQFRSMVRYLHKGLLIDSDQQYYQLTLVPENYETEIALLLLYLSSGLEDGMNSVFKQMLWGLALVKTLRTGLANLDEGDTRWDPDASFANHYRDAEGIAPTEGEEAIAALSAELRSNLADLKNIIDAEVLFSLLKTLAASKSLEGFGAFLARESEREVGQQAP